jgi:hypothetical protein
MAVSLDNAHLQPNKVSSKLSMGAMLFFFILLLMFIKHGIDCCF